MKRFVTVAAAFMAAGVVGMTGCKKETADTTTANTDTRTAGQKAGDAVEKAVDKTGDAAKAAADKMRAATQPSADAAVKNTRSTLSSFSEAALTKGGLNDVVERFSKADRDRIGKFDKSSFTDLDAAIETFRNDWKAKYNQDFKLSDKEQLIYGAPIEIKAGDITDNVRLAAERTGPNGANTADQKAVNNTTTVTFPAAGDAPAVTVHLQNEGTVMNSYKIDVPDTLDGSKLKANLISHITMVDQMKDKWPADPNEAYRIVSQHLLAAVTDAK